MTHLFSTTALSRFRGEETGAVSVDWVVLCALVTALTLAMSDRVGTALGFFSDDVTEELTDSEIVRAGEENQVAFGFEGGDTGRWSGSSVANVLGFGEVLGPIAGSNGAETLTHDFIIASDVENAGFSFDLLALDSLDDEAGVLYVNGQEVGRVIVGHDYVTFEPRDVPGIQVSVNTAVLAQDIGGFRGVQNTDDVEDYWKDSVINVAISVDDPGDVVSFGFGSTADQGTGDESFAIDNFVAVGVQADTPASGSSSNGGSADNS